MGLLPCYTERDGFKHAWISRQRQEESKTEELAMKLLSAIPLLLTVLVGFMLGLVAWGVLRLRHRTVDDAFLDTDNRILVGLLVLGVLALGAFLTYLLLGLGA
jgi:uncharacterized BrkB/YihY/UPF0761 family membrane protein